jgi:drug/metabolite transporter (DMT)-like permease
LAVGPARALGAFAFTRIQFVVCAALLAVICSAFSLWASASFLDWSAYVIIVLTAIIGHLALTTCLRYGGARRTEVMLSLKAPIVAAMAYLWLGEIIGISDTLGGLVCVAGVLLAVTGGDQTDQLQDTSFGGLFVFVGLGLIATICHGLGFLVAKPALEAGTHPFVVSAIRLIGAGALMSIMAISQSSHLRPHVPMTASLFIQTIVPGIIGYIVATTLLLYAFAKMEAGIAAVLGSLAPVLILPIVAIRNRRAPDFQAIGGAIIAVCGAAVIVIY